MISKKLKQVTLYYLNNLLKRSLPEQAKKDLLDWAERYAKDLFGMEMVSNYEIEDGAAGTRWKLPRNIKALRTVLARQEIIDITHRGYDKNLDMMFCIFKIAPDAQPVLRYMVYEETMPLLNDLKNEFRSSVIRRIFFAMVAQTPSILEKNLSEEGHLVTKGIIELDKHYRTVSLSTPFRRVLGYCFRNITEEKIRQAMIGKAATTTLDRNNFKYLAEDYDHIATLLRNSLKARKSGVNILLYGIPGTGKTELCKAIAAEIGAKLYMLSEDAENDKAERITELAFVQGLLEDERDAVLLFDEAEDVFFNSIFVKNNSSKLYFNRMLERNKTPVIWVTNNIRCMDPAYIRRFKYVLEVKKPDKAAKEEIWKNISAKHRVKLPATEIATLSKKYDVPPALIDTAIGAAKVINDKKGTVMTIERTIEALHRAAYGGIPINKEKEDKTPFITDLLNTDTDLGGLADKFAAKGALRFSLCLYGASGTGKSAFARHLAELLGIEIMHKRASDLMSCYVGETEKNIAEAFEEARKEKAMLIFDEADSLLRDRKQAIRSWEISQVNEMLTWMEDHPYPFICTTNLMQDIDEASLRRFTFKVKYNHLKPAQVKLAFRHFFGIDIDAPPAQLTHLTPGDFAVVNTKRELLGITNKSELTAMLESEQSAKGIKSTKMGFA